MKNVEFAHLSQRLCLAGLMILAAPVLAQTAAPEAWPAMTPVITPKPTPSPSPSPQATATATPTASPSPTPTPEVFSLLGRELVRGQSQRLTWKARYGFGELDASAPVQVAHGAKPGPTLCLTAAVHGDELNGIEIVRRVMHGIDLNELSGTVIGVPIVNIPGFLRGSRYLPDRRDLNRYFPGDPNGSLASRIAHDFFERIIRHCDQLVDLHTGSFARTNLPQLRADLTDHAIVEMTKGFGAIAVLHSTGADGTLRRAAALAGIPSVTLEAGEPERLQTEEVVQGVKGVESLMSAMGMTPKKFVWRNPQPVFYESQWVRADRGGIFFTDTQLGDVVNAGDILGTVTDPLSNVRTDVIAPVRGRVLGKALNQFVMPGFAAFRLGVETSEEQIAEEPVATAAPDETSSSTESIDEPEQN